MGKVIDMGTDERASINVLVSKAHREALQRIMESTRPQTNMRSLIEYLIEQEAAARGIEIEQAREEKGEA